MTSPEKDWIYNLINKDGEVSFVLSDLAFDNKRKLSDLDLYLYSELYSKIELTSQL